MRASNERQVTAMIGRIFKVDSPTGIGKKGVISAAIYFARAVPNLQHPSFRLSAV
jgi:hypothetical protein